MFLTYMDLDGRGFFLTNDLYRLWYIKILSKTIEYYSRNGLTFILFWRHKGGKKILKSITNMHELNNCLHTKVKTYTKIDISAMFRLRKYNIFIIWRLYSWPSLLSYSNWNVVDLESIFIAYCAVNRFFFLPGKHCAF